jgi:hypothetical protein
MNVLAWYVRTVLRLAVTRDGRVCYEGAAVKE